MKFLASFLNSLSGKPKSTKVVAGSKVQLKKGLTRTEMGKLPGTKVRGLFDTIENCVYFDNGKVVQVPSRHLKAVNERTKTVQLVQQWAQYRGLIKQGEYIIVR